jgi:hypothetical protein
MSAALEWLLGLERIRLGAGWPLSLRFATPPAAWVMLAGAVIAAVGIHVVYRRQGIGRGWRRVLSLVRLGAVLLVLFVLGQPALVASRNRVDASRVVVLVDSSMSMNTRDGGRLPAEGAGSRSRLQQAVEWLARPGGGLLARLAPEQRVGLWAFADRASPLEAETPPADRPRLAARLAGLSADGPRSDLATGLQEVLDAEQGRRLAGIVVVSDGRQTAPSPVEGALAEAAARGVPVHTFAVGSGRPLMDLALDYARGEEEVFVRDTVSVHAGIRCGGYAMPTLVEVELRDASSGEVLGRRKAVLPEGDQAVDVELVYRPGRTGRRALRVVVLPREDEENPDNNSLDLVIHARDDKIGVLYVEGYPRFEYRYLKNMLLREPTLESSCLLLGASPGFVQEGTRPIRRFPQSVEELRAYDVVILGDVDLRTDWLTAAQQAMLCDHVSTGGAGLAFIAGERSAPHGLRNTPLERLLPVRIDPEFFGRYDQPLLESFALQFTREAGAGNLFPAEPGADGASSVLPESLPGWYWFARVLGPQPAASVLAVHPRAMCAEGPMPLAVLGRFGLGRTFYLGSDDAWRWRQFSGESYYEGFWLRVIRTLARGRKFGNDPAWRLETDRRRYEAGQKVQFRLVAAGAGAAADLREATVQVTDLHRGLLEEVVGRPVGEGRSAVEGSFSPRAAGHLTLSAMPPGMAGGKRVTCDIDIVVTDAERLRPEADHEFLRMISGRTQGRFLRDGDDLSDLLRGIPDMSVQIADDIQEPIWDKGWVMVLFCGLLGAEWIARKALGLA